jgi:hypothetical protein
VADKKDRFALISRYKKITFGLNNSMYLSIILVLLYVIILLLVLGFVVYDYKIENYTKSHYLWFIIEIIIFGLCNALPYMYIFANRTEEEGSYSSKIHASLFETLLLFIKMSILHILLQSSGFYRNTMGWH